MKIVYLSNFQPSHMEQSAGDVEYTDSITEEEFLPLCGDAVGVLDMMLNNQMVRLQ